jgi:hypothetical protein
MVSANVPVTIWLVQRGDAAKPPLFVTAHDETSNNMAIRRRSASTWSWGKKTSELAVSDHVDSKRGLFYFQRGQEATHCLTISKRNKQGRNTCRLFHRIRPGPWPSYPPCPPSAVWGHAMPPMARDPLNERNCTERVAVLCSFYEEDRVPRMSL